LRKDQFFMNGIFVLSSERATKNSSNPYWWTRKQY